MAVARAPAAIAAWAGDLGEPQGSAMEWEEALLAAWGGEIPTQLSALYRRRAVAAEARAVLGVLPDFVRVHRHALRHVKR